MHRAAQLDGRSPEDIRPAALRDVIAQ